MVGLTDRKAAERTLVLAHAPEGHAAGEIALQSGKRHQCQPDACDCEHQRPESHRVDVVRDVVAGHYESEDPCGAHDRHCHGEIPGAGAPQTAEEPVAEAQQAEDETAKEIPAAQSLADAAEKGDAAAVQDALAATREAYKASNGLATDLGLDKCAAQ